MEEKVGETDERERGQRETDERGERWKRRGRERKR